MLPLFETLTEDKFTILHNLVLDDNVRLPLFHERTTGPSVSVPKPILITSSRPPDLTTFLGIPKGHTETTVFVRPKKILEEHMPYIELLEDTASYKDTETKTEFTSSAYTRNV